MTATIDELSTSDIQSDEQTDEALRLAALRRYDILDTPPDGSFDRIAAIAADLFSVPIAIVSLVDEDRIWFKSHHGWMWTRPIVVPAFAIRQSCGPIRAYCLTPGPICTPLRILSWRASSVYASMSACRFEPMMASTWERSASSTASRAPSPNQIAQLKALASIVMDQMELRLSERRALADLSGIVAELSRTVDEKEVALRRAS